MIRDDEIDRAVAKPAPETLSALVRANSEAHLNAVAPSGIASASSFK